MGAFSRPADPEGIPRDSLATFAPVDAAKEVRLPAVLQLLLPVVLGLLLLVLGLAAAPARALPRPVFEVVDGRRELLAFSALCVLGLGLVAGLLAVLVAS